MCSEGEGEYERDSGVGVYEAIEAGRGPERVVLVLRLLLVLLWLRPRPTRTGDDKPEPDADAARGDGDGLGGGVGGEVVHVGCGGETWWER